ncbi:MAG: hypothetical protein R3E83_11380 [Burkholderiaceae bacterium]
MRHSSAALPEPQDAATGLPDTDPDEPATLVYLRGIAGALTQGDLPASQWQAFDRLLRNFEAKRRLYRDYAPGFTSRDRTDHDDLRIYAAFAWVLVQAADRRSPVRYANALLKAIDILCACQDRIDRRWAPLAVALIARARVAGRDCPPAGGELVSGGCILLVGADGPRARAYAGALGACQGVRVQGLFYGEDQPAREAPGAPAGWPAGLDLPMIATPVGEQFRQHAWAVSRFARSASINAPEVVAALAAADADLAVFCGRGGEIVSPQVLDAAPPMLHCHPGRLPAERGSTTIYYSLLAGRRCAVSALLLAPEIDAGPVLATREYPRPGAGCDLDVLFDCAIRADMLRHMVERFAREGSLQGTAAGEGEGELFFVVHPVLKHIALLSLGSAESSASRSD